MTSFMSPQLVFGPKSSNAVSNCADKPLYSSVDHHEVVHHTAEGAGWKEVWRCWKRWGGGAAQATLRLSALSLKIRVFETLPMEKPGFFLNADILINKGIRIKPKNSGFWNPAFGKTRVFADILHDGRIQFQCYYAVKTSSSKDGRILRKPERKRS